MAAIVEDSRAKTYNFSLGVGALNGMALALLVLRMSASCAALARISAAWAACCSGVWGIVSSNDCHFTTPPS